jgi:adenylate cyclase class 2
MAFEVENKFAVSDSTDLQRRVCALGAEYLGVESQADTYFSHPHRDFLLTDEALRVRSANGRIQITYKGKRAQAVVKIREELELPVAPIEQAESRTIELLERLGFRLLARLHKRRSTYRWGVGQAAILICLDEVDELGAFVEIELLVEGDQLTEATRRIERLQSQLQLGTPIQVSYLRMILARRAEDAGKKFAGDA